MSGLSRLLVVEDQPLLLLGLIDDLAEHGLDVLPASNARTAARLLDTGIDALVTDIELGEGPDGLALARLASSARPGLPIVVLSGGVRPRPEALPPGATFFPKPCSVERIIAALQAQALARAA